MTKLVFFDLDGTIIDNPSSEKLFFYHLLKNRYIGLKQIWATCTFTIKWWSHFKREIVVKNKGYLAGLPINTITTLAEKFTRQYLMQRIRPRVKQLLDEHRKAKDIIVLLTGSPDFIADTFATYLAVDDLYAAELAHNSHYFINEPPPQHPYALEKLKVAKDACNKHAVKMNETIVYANSIHDKALLDACGLPITVTPDRKLRRIAIQKGWQIID